MTRTVETDIIFDKTTGEILGRGKFGIGGTGNRRLWHAIAGKDAHIPHRPEIDHLRVSSKTSNEWVTVERTPGEWKVIPASKAHPNQDVGDRIDITKN